MTLPRLPSLARLSPVRTLPASCFRSAPSARHGIPFGETSRQSRAPARIARGCRSISGQRTPGRRWPWHARFRPAGRPSWLRPEPWAVADMQNHRSPAVFIVGNGNAPLQMSEHRPFCSVRVNALNRCAIAEARLACACVNQVRDPGCGAGRPVLRIEVFSTSPKTGVSLDYGFLSARCA
jgi:hypothetical protein